VTEFLQGGLFVLT